MSSSFTTGTSEAWFRHTGPVSDCGPRIPPAFILEEQSRGESYFRQEYLCEFIETGKYIFDEQLIHKITQTRTRCLHMDITHNPKTSSVAAGMWLLEVRPEAGPTGGTHFRAQGTYSFSHPAVGRASSPRPTSRSRSALPKPMASPVVLAKLGESSRLGADPIPVSHRHHHATA